MIRRVRHYLAAREPRVQQSAPVPGTVGYNVGDLSVLFGGNPAVTTTKRQVPGLHAAWDLLSGIGVTPAGTSLRSAQRRGQRTTAELVDEHGISCRPIRGVLVRYLHERRPARVDTDLVEQGAACFQPGGASACAGGRGHGGASMPGKPYG